MAAVPRRIPSADPVGLCRRDTTERIRLSKAFRSLAFTSQQDFTPLTAVIRKGLIANCLYRDHPQLLLMHRGDVFVAVIPTGE